MKSKVTYFLILALGTVVFSSCGVKRNNFIARKFHNTTTYFNYLYNAEQKWKEGVDKINGAYRVPPEGFIPVWWAGTEDDSKAYGNLFEQAIEKCEIALQKHNQKDNKWMDDCRFVIGKSWFYKRNYILATKNFEYVLKTYPDSKIIPDVYLWMVKTYFMDGNSTRALKALNEDLPKQELKKRHLGELALIKAQINLEEENYDEVIRVLNANKKNIKGRNNRARVYFLLGQLQQSKGSYEYAYENYKKVTKINTDYELIFNAKLNIAKLNIMDDRGLMDERKLARYMKRMLRDEKNLDYRDRIYYEMAMIDLKQGDRPGAIGNLKNSIATNTDNQRQKALSYYKIGQIYFYDLQDFTNAEAYFDSASTAITKDAPEYQEITTVSRTLKEYVGYVNTIQLNDSLLVLSRLSDKELEEEVDRVLEAQKKADEAAQAKELEELDRLNDPNLFGNFGDEGKKQRNQDFYFDNPGLVSGGKIEFEQKWGNRKNEDNWRRKNKALQVQNDALAEGEEVEISDEELEKYGSAERAKMIKMVPRTDEDIATANGKVEAALYGLGQVFENKLNVLDSAMATYGRLIRRYPDGDFAMKARYAMYRIHKEKVPDELLAEEYKNEICRRAPNGRYCRYCNGEVVSEEGDNEDFKSAYNALYMTYARKDCESCVDFAKFIQIQHAGNPEIAKVMMIQAKCHACNGQQDSLVAIYRRIRRDYPESSITPEVIQLLNIVDGKENPTANAGNPRGNDPKNQGGAAGANDPRFRGFTMDKKPHEKIYVVFFVDKDKLKSNELQIKVNDFNKRYYQEKRLNVSIFLYQNQLHMPYISQFNSYEEALNYIGGLSKDADIAALIDKPEEKMVCITPGNFRTAYGKRRFSDYFLYYENVVLNSIDGN